MTDREGVSVDLSAVDVVSTDFIKARLMVSLFTEPDPKRISLFSRIAKLLAEKVINFKHKNVTFYKKNGEYFIFLHMYIFL